MLKNILKITFILIIGATFTSCGSNEAATRKHAEELCDCMEDIGLDESLSLADLNNYDQMREMEKKAEESLPKCAFAILKNIQSDLDELNKSEKKDYTKSFLKNVIDTECADVILDKVPFDMMGMLVVQMEKEVDRAERRRKRRMN
jgi:hypothetical protein